MKAVWKYPLNLIGATVIEVPPGAKPLTVELQYGQPVMWALVDADDERREQRVFEFIGTGHKAVSDATTHRDYVGTLMLEGGTLVLHAFDVTPPER